MRNAAKVIGWFLIIGYTLHAGLNVINSTVPDSLDDGPRAESLVDTLSERHQSRPLEQRLVTDFLLIALGVVLVAVSRPKHSLDEAPRAEAEAVRAEPIPRLSPKFPDRSKNSRRNAILKVVLVAVLVGGVILVWVAQATNKADDSVVRKVLDLQTSVLKAELLVAGERLVALECSTYSECDEALRDYRTTLIPYWTILGTAVVELGALKEATADPALLGVVNSYREFYSVTLEAVRLDMEAIGSKIDIALLEAGDKKWEESELRANDVSDALDRYAGIEK